MKSKVYNAVTWIIAIVGIIGSIIAGAVMHSFVFVLFGIISVALLCLIFGGITCILGYLEELGAGQAKADTSEIHGNASPNSKSKGDKWECPNCHTMNNYSDNPECPNCHWKP